MNEKLDKLISLAITDGIITDKERDILLRKATEEGVDLDEFEMYFEAKLFEKQQELKEQTAAQILPPPLEKKSNKEGDLKKCPSCGAPVQSFATKCSDCGHEFRNIQAASSVQKLFEMLNALEGGRGEDETNPLKAMGGLFGQMASGKSVFSGGKIGQQKNELIKNFPIPNTKEDILEFLALAVPRAKKKGTFMSNFSQDGFEIKAHDSAVPIWLSKCEQIIMKARFSMKEDKATLAEIEHYARELKIK